MNETSHPRTIKSFVIREGRLTQHQQHALDTLWSRYVLPADAMLDWVSVFPSFYKESNPVILEIGFGMGHALLQNAQQMTESCFVGIEVYRPGIGNLLTALEKQHIENVRVLYGDAVMLLDRCVPDHSLDAVHIFFPDPWPKRRHHKRRLIQVKFVELVMQKLKVGGRLHLATDWEDYAQHMLRVLSEVKACMQVLDIADDQAHRPLTKYEKRGQKLGHKVWDLVFLKKNN